MPIQATIDVLKRGLRRLPDAGVELGLPPAWFGYRGVRHETVSEYLARHGGAAPGTRSLIVHRESAARHALPENVASPDFLPDDRGWWGFSFRDVLARSGGETSIVTLPDCLITWYEDPDQDHDFFPAVLTHDDRALALRELRFRPRHADVLRSASPPAHVERVTWILERVYHNHSHWITAHLPKLLLLRDYGGLDEVLIPRRRTETMEGSMRSLGLPPDRFRTFDPDRPLRVERLTIVQNDRFRPELLRMVRDAFAGGRAKPGGRRIYVSRARSARRHLVNEDEVWRLLKRSGFERVFMEELSFDEQVRLMNETAVLAGPHGAGLTNMIFCAAGSHIVEIADLSFPNPNFYAMAAGLDHHYWIVEGKTATNGHPLERDLRVDVSAVRDVIDEIDSTCSST